MFRSNFKRLKLFQRRGVMGERLNKVERLKWDGVNDNFAGGALRSSD